MLKTISQLLAGVLILVVGGAWAEANVRLPAVIGDNMVLQADSPLPIWGWADAGEEVAVTLGDEKVTAKADDQGRWKVTLSARKSNAASVEMTVAGKNTIKIENIVIGEVWAGSGQSNMQWAVRQSANAKAEMAAANNPQIRLFVIPNRVSAVPLDDVRAKWVVCTPDTVAGSSAVLYFFGRDLQKTLNVPVGLITVAWGGTRIEPWIPAESFSTRPELKAELETYNTAMTRRSNARRETLKKMKTWLAAAEQADAAGKEFTDPPAFDSEDIARTTPAGIYNGMVHGINPFALRGFLWYQGESNHDQGMHYTQMQKALVEAWRRLWNSKDLPFLYVQLAPYVYGNEKETILPEFWEAQTACLAVPNTGMAVITDIATTNDIHPPNKQDVGKRLALWALAKTYGKSDLVCSGPLYDSMSIEGNRVRLKFRHTGGGLVARDGKPLNWFAVAGNDQQFHKAEAKIEGDSVIVSCPAVSSPVAVRFGWSKIAEPNLSNKAGLPASPFRTDQWTDARNAVE